MRRQSVAELHPGMVIARTVYADDGKVLLAAGASLTSAYIQALVKRDIVAVLIQDGWDDLTTPVDVVSEHTDLRAPTTVRRLSKIVAWAMHRRVEDGYGRLRQSAAARARARATLAEQADPPRPEVMVEVEAEVDRLDGLYRDVSAIVDQVLAPRVVSLLERLREHSPMAFEHSIDVTIVSILIASGLGLTRARLRCLALGCLLHDIGKLEIGRAILEKTDRLSRSELEQFRQHPSIGYTMMRDLKIPSPLPAAVVIQHHERQDGEGYPLGLVGTNRVYRTRVQRLVPGQISLLAEIAAVADVYSTLVLDAPHRPAFPIGQAVEILRHLSGHGLNREIVERMLSLVPVFPIGHWVEVVGGAYDGWQGVVVRIRPDTIMQPTIRLLVDVQGEPVTDSIEVDLADDPTMSAILLSETASPEPQPA